ncbi:YceI family protein [uncultured Lacinutrix sp.]|uniref:YceI family protein n=1 Tax=uncultured Lacinutrix sp. TaxID=574032 RepID=UPI0026332143|nr:YceI family protein [uncultured Lacinutrix sp.]
MKKQVLNIFTIAALGLAIVGCKNEKEAQTTEAKEVEKVVAEATFKAVPAESMIMWKANKVVGGHEGTINVSNGVAKMKGDALVGGNFVFDIATLKNTDIEDAEGNGKLVGHLKSADFFDAEKFPSAAFEITAVEGNKVSGNLMMKGIKKNVTFDATVSTTGNEMTITSDTFTIDRTEWNIMYNSGKVMDAAKLGDYMINDNVEIKISVKANKA